MTYIIDKSVRYSSLLRTITKKPTITLELF